MLPNGIGAGFVDAFDRMVFVRFLLMDCRAFLPAGISGIFRRDPVAVQHPMFRLRQEIFFAVTASAGSVSVVHSVEQIPGIEIYDALKNVSAHKDHFFFFFGIARENIGCAHIGRHRKALHRSLLHLPQIRFEFISVEALYGSKRKSCLTARLHTANISALKISANTNEGKQTPERSGQGAQIVQNIFPQGGDRSGKIVNGLFADERIDISQLRSSVHTQKRLLFPQ